MLIDLSNVLSEPHKSIDETVACTLDAFNGPYDAYPVTSKSDVHVTVRYIGDRQLEVGAECDLALEIPCDRCLEPVTTDFEIRCLQKVKLSESEEDAESDEFDEANYIQGYTLDVDKLICNEVIVGWPAKILCSEDCKGICHVCGQNLNKGTCDCEDTGLDPRMSVIRDVFKNFKEV